MRVLSIREPWATLIKEKKKRIETRSWKISYRGEIYIHASLKKIDKNDPHIRKLLESIPNVPLGYGCILCKCELADCKPINDEFRKTLEKRPQERLCGDYSNGRYAWILENIKTLETPIKAIGRLGLWKFKTNPLNHL